MPLIPRDVAQMLINKLDLNFISAKEAKDYAKRYGIEIKGRTRASVASEIGKASVSHYQSAVTGAEPKLTEQLIAGLRKSL